ncbi:unnamed protein product [Wuchereria bancrofti]|uniref:Uncharacterized protein n=1 Tax=Wuchereria bancrofti TaxID=6293 RepID=A0A3P7DTN4_WUCBA|nr:unnamed protein product [Wuchereria bancrofti]
MRSCWCFSRMLRQRKLDEALRAGVDGRRVNVDKVAEVRFNISVQHQNVTFQLMASTVHTLINYNIEFTPASTSQDTMQSGSVKICLFCRYILLKPENEPAKKKNITKNVQSRKSTAQSGFCKFHHKQHNNEMKQNRENRKSIRKKWPSTTEKCQQKKRRKMNKS